MDNLELKRYTRQLLLPEWSEKEQEKLKNTTVFIAGAGGTGSPTITMLALAGVGKIRICDFDVFEETNKNRQFIHCLADERLGLNKAESAAMTVKNINPNVIVEYFSEKFNETNIDELVGDSDFIFDCVDRFKYKFVLADCAMRKKIPMFFYGIMDYNCFANIFYPPYTPCFHCLFDEKKIKTVESFKTKKADIAVMAPTLFMAAGLMVTLAMKMIIGYEKASYNEFLLYFGKQKNCLNDRGVRAFKFWNTKYFNSVSKMQGFNWNNQDVTDMFITLHVEKNPECPFCSETKENTSII